MKIISTKFTRANITESSHEVKILLSNLNGKVLYTTGNENDLIYPRSSVKIFQAIPFVNSQAIQYFNLNSKIVALSCSSHRGENFHLKELKNWLRLIGMNKNILKCGIHNPLNVKANEQLLRANKKTNELHNNCAGKHLAMITSCIINNYSTKNYLKLNHPHQLNIRKIFEKFSNNKISIKNYGIDGCSAPQYSFKMKDISEMLINLVKSYNSQFEYSEEVKYLINSIIKYPKYIGGTDSLDSIIMGLSDKIFCKGGAEGVVLFADLKKEIIGVIKVVDGNERAIPAVLYKLFNKFKIMNNKQLKEFSKFYKFKLVNHAKIVIGSIRTNI